MAVDVLGALWGKILFEQTMERRSRYVSGSRWRIRPVGNEQRKIDGTPPLPFIQIRARGGPRSANWTAEGLRRVDVFGFGPLNPTIQADALSQSVDDYRRGQTLQLRLAAHPERIGPTLTIQICPLH